ncbi:MAG: hypothetical protein WC205_09885 [Opitutaceae bacterium]|jgi:hypothetical protein
MDWILDHLQIVIAIAGAIAYWLNARSKANAGEADGDGTPGGSLHDGRTQTSEPARRIDYDDNMRRLQEEIRRKIAERQAGAGRPVQPSASVQSQSQSQSQPRAQVAARRVETERADAAVLERQRMLAEQLAALKAQRAEAGRAAKSAMWTPQPAASLETAAARSDDVHWLKELRGARSLRKAIVLREVLGTPVGLR